MASCVLLFVVTWCLVSGARGVDFSEPEERGRIDDDDLHEASGLAASRRHANLLYAHNDAGGSPRLFAIDGATAEVVAEYDVTDARCCDWEDVAVGEFRGFPAIYVGDIGGNSDSGHCNTEYVVPEPGLVQDGPAVALRTIVSAQFTWDERDAETLMVAPDGTVYVITKVEDGEAARLYYLPPHAFDDGVGPVPALGGTALGVVDPDHKGPVAGDISPNGTEVLIKFKDKVFYWGWNFGSEPLGGVLAGAGQEVPVYREEDGEAVAWDTGAVGFYTLSEGRQQPLCFYEKISP